MIAWMWVQVPEAGLQYMTRILYEAAVGEDDTWGEHEVDFTFHPGTEREREKREIVRE